MIPGIADHIPADAQIDDKELVKIKSVISSMTSDERRSPERFIVTSWEEVIDGGRRKKKRSAFYDQRRLRRVARGSGRRENDVADILNRFAMMRQMMMQLGASTGMLGKVPGLKQLGQLRQIQKMAKSGGLDMSQLANMMSAPTSERPRFSAPQRAQEKAKDKQKRRDQKKARKKNR
jgi:signal recognition particle subunit SRP54